MADTRENFSGQDKPLTVGGVRIGSAVSQAISHSFSRVKDFAEALFDNFTGGRSRLFGGAVDNPANLTNQPVPLRRRAGTLKPSFADRDNKAYIEILSRRAEGSRLSVGRFDDFVMLAIQEQDAEKVDVTETFGQPHIFASGRFIRRFTFSVACRAAPANYLGNTADLRLSQHAAFRFFYDKYLRATQQIERGQHTRIVVDGDVFEGYVTTLNQSRDAQNEYWAMFVFSMLGTKRSNDRQDGDAMRSLQRFEQEPERTQPLTSQIPQAELLDSHGELELTLFGAGVVGGKKELTLPAPIEMSISDQAAPRITVQLEGKGYPGRVEVSQEGVVGVELTLASDPKTALNKAFIHASQEGIQNALALAVQYHRLYQSLREEGVAAGTTIERTVSFTIKSQSGSEVVFNVPFKLKGKPTLQLGPVTLTVTNGSTIQPTKSTGAKSSFQHRAYLDGSAGLLAPLGAGLGNSITVRYVIEVHDHKGTFIDLSTLDPSTIVFSHGGPDVSPATGSTEDIDHLPPGDQFRIPDVKESSGDPLQTSIVDGRIVLEGTIEFRFDNDSGSAADLSKGPTTATIDDNPFTLADRVLIRFPDAKLKIAGYEEIADFSKPLGIAAMLSNMGPSTLLLQPHIAFHESFGSSGRTVEGGTYHIASVFHLVMQVNWGAVHVENRDRSSYIRDVLIPQLRIAGTADLQLGKRLTVVAFNSIPIIGTGGWTPARTIATLGSGGFISDAAEVRFLARITDINTFGIEELSLRFEVAYSHQQHDAVASEGDAIDFYAGNIRSLLFKPGTTRIGSVNYIGGQ